ncbi:MAG: hypothetical protein Q7V20_07840 [Aquabacterium sp.]|uniref:hypothetical protein n=1 Tax=Aquabacterium sp. TaxID=1872578 RepID=UPI00271A4201|nr:hypothetical protein [Aquabacterium sp.]MDO9003344.1 hypothetical protein [Aquabacterium sp.]
MSGDTAVLGSASTNVTRGSSTDAKATYDADLLLFDPKNEAVLVVPKEKAKEFLQEANQMEALCKALIDAKERLITLEEKLAKAETARWPTLNEVNHLTGELKKAQKKYDEAYAAVKVELGDKGYLATSGNGKEMLELIPLSKRKAGGKPQVWGRKWTYVRSDKVRSHYRSYQLSTKDKKAQTASFIKNGKIDTKTLKEQFGKLEPKFKAEWEDHTAGFMLPNLQAWADDLNRKSEGKHISFAYGVQLFRYFAGCSAGVEWNPKGGKIAGKLNGKAELMVAQGEASAEGYLPNSDGWAWALTGMKSGKEFHIGALRFMAQVKLTAAAGASAAAELGLEVDYSQLTKAGVKGAGRPKGTDPNAKKASLEKVGAEAGLGADLFAGAKAGGEFTGALEYKSPKTVNEKFKAMASVGPKVEVQFGAGAAACLMVHYDKGKFRLKAKAGLCFGAGAKGEIGLEVDALHIAEFMEWLFRALLNANFEMLQILTSECYRSAVRLQVMMLNGVGDAYRNVDQEWSDFQKKLDLEDQRVKLMERVLTDPAELRLCVPEAHGILLHQLTRHGSLTAAHPANSGWTTNSFWDGFEFLGQRKKAVMQVCQWAQSKRQFENMVQHMNAKGSKGGFRGNYDGLLRFMEVGPLDSNYDDALRVLYARLPDEPARGFPLAMNNTVDFSMQARMKGSPQYMALLNGQGTRLSTMA